MGLQIGLHFDDEAANLEIRGILDISTAHILEGYIQKLIGIKGLTIDLSGLEFIDSTGVGAIMEIIYHSIEHSFSIELKGMSGPIHEILETVGLLTMLETIAGRAV
ncbi:STAS domain-containing protein [Geobacillus sp. G4]|uniref:STAS domain-containing protein n=3 Tax=Geobacillus TaxID=129337 RepID=Q5KZX4_GEOKA|nr:MULTISPECIES: STAS domain-containing protein [Geobacillus]AMV10716.1 anti-anti-sigma factor [Geobacillus thermoleovorans]AUI35587.1 anti-sigma factor antagonist [[Bacillus] caldolyticus]ESU71743.1 anti-sigma-factor antagonist [Geobacillus sp. MAS1]TLS33399.1 STAS domain-containing protein [Geobacillus thermoleovorans]TRY43571.1 STAS domain-containing protein [Geobacillus sp. LEMMJ02]